MDKVYIIGLGGVGYCLLEIFKKERLYYDCSFVIIEPKKTIKGLEEVMEGRPYVHMKQRMTKENLMALLGGVDKNTFVINVSVNVDSIMILKHTKARGAWYIDTSLEQYEDTVDNIPLEDITKYSQFKKNNLYHRNIEAFKAVGNSRKTRIISGGMNPGFISEYAKRTLKEYAKTKGRRIVNSNYAKVAHELGLTEIQIVEYDSQKIKKSARATPTKFVNTWSSIGFQEESADFVMISLNNKDMERLGKEYTLIKPIESSGKEDTHIRFIPKYGIDIKRESIALDDKGKPFKYTGYLIPHAEIITMSEFFQYKPKGEKQGDAPTIMYVYRPCDEAMKSIDHFRQNDYENLPEEKVVKGEDILSGWDSIGTLLTFKNGDRFGGWTICGIKDARRLGFKSGPTCLQVGAFLNGAIKWALKNPNKGLNNSETVPHKFIFKHGEKYCGKVIFKYI